MAFDPAEFLRLARRIHGDPELQSPAGIRTAVSRCYYSALLKARDVLVRSGTEVGVGDSMHRDIIDILAKGPASGDDLVDDLGNMNLLRIAADLDVGSSTDIGDLNHAYSLADAFNRNIERRFARGGPRPFGRAP